MTQILVIEDDINVRSLILKLLQAEGFNTVSAENGLLGIKLAKLHEPDLIICDIMMPECDGYEVLSHLRQDPNTATIPFIFLSAKSDRTDLRQGMESGADDYLTKPFKRAELLGAISARLEKRVTQTQPYVDEMKRAAQTLSQMAYRDPLTNLPNRILLHHQFQTALTQATRSQQLVAVMCINLNRFKAINMNLGYANGDLLLKQVAARLEAVFTNQGSVGRVGGDEFGVIIHLASREAAEAIAHTTLKQLGEAYDLDGHYVQIGISIGISLYPSDGDSPDRLLSQADTAMRHIKAQSKSGYQFYTVEMDALATERQLMESKLNLALERQEFQIYYQPQVNLITGRIIGAEALLRWQDPELGLVQPAKFIAIAEETGLIIPIGEWVLRAACTQAKIWQQASHLPIRVSVNLSARQFRQEGLVDMVAQTLQSTGLNADVLVLELTETSVMEDVENTIVILKQLKAMGVHISIDDFGTGYSSLNYLKRFPIDTLKIDQSFIREVTTDPNDAAIAKAIIAMAQSLQLKVIAEGVETEEQRAFLRQSGCHAMQGYLFSKPIVTSEFDQLLQANTRLASTKPLSGQ